MKGLRSRSQRMNDPLRRSQRKKDPLRRSQRMKKHPRNPKPRSVRYVVLRQR